MAATLALVDCAPAAQTLLTLADAVATATPGRHGNPNFLDDGFPHSRW